MPYQPDNARLRAGMAWTMIRLNRQPMADNVWNVAAQNPDAISALGDALKSKGDAEGAKAVWQRLKDTVPTYAPKLEGKL
jgi:cytochrome c-type biogenesis protein CcmH/NrfG